MYDEPKQMARPDNSDEIEKVRCYVEAAETEINDLKIIPRIATKYAFDSIALSTVSKAFALSKACLSLLDCGFPDEAYGLSRSLVECATNLRYLTEDSVLQDGRTDDFVKYFLASKSFWLHYALQLSVSPNEEQRIREYAKQMGIDSDTKSARRHWSGKNGFVWDVSVLEHPLDGPVTVRHKKIAYAADYHNTSVYVHCSQGAVDNYFPEERTAFRVSPSSGEYSQPSQVTLFIILIYLQFSIAYALHGLSLERPAKLNTLFEETLNDMKPVPRLHR